jgi:hypothetical protein
MNEPRIDPSASAWMTVPHSSSSGVPSGFSSRATTGEILAESCGGPDSTSVICTSVSGSSVSSQVPGIPVPSMRCAR